jgi:DegV family protein with EDD domain
MVVRIGTDSTSDISQKKAEELGIKVVPLEVQFGKKGPDNKNPYLKDGVEIMSEEFYNRFVEEGGRTTQPSPETCYQIFAKFPKNDPIAMLTLSSKLSGTYNSAIVAGERREKEGGARVEVINTDSVSGGLAILAEKALAMSRAGMSLKEIVREIEQLRKKIRLYASFDTLTYLRDGGRIGKAKAFAGNLLHVKPIVAVKDGEIVPISQRERSLENAISFFADRLPVSAERAHIMYAQDTALLPLLRSLMESKYPGLKITQSQLGPVLGVYSGRVFYGAVVLEK